MKANTRLRAADWALLRDLRVRRRLPSSFLVELSQAADGGKLWIGAAAGMALMGRRGRRGAAQGLLGVGVTSLLVNGPAKWLIRRPRPTGTATLGLKPAGRAPTTSSMPSGHAASAAAFAAAAGTEWPAIAGPLALTAMAVGWSRVHTARHFPTDVLAGAALGALVGGSIHRIYGPLLSRVSTKEVLLRKVFGV